MPLNRKIKYAYTWFKIDKNLPDEKFDELEEKELKLTGDLGWELVQIMELKNHYKYIFKRTRRKDE
jgi:hypothetical protein